MKPRRHAIRPATPATAMPRRRGQQRAARYEGWWRSPFRRVRRCGYVLARHRRDGVDEAGNLYAIGLPAPAGQIDRMILAEAEWWRRAIERHRNELAKVAAFRRFVAHPVGFDRGARPADDDRVAAGERSFDGFRKYRASLDHRIPPDLESGGLECFCKLRRLLLVGSGVTQEYGWWGHSHTIGWLPFSNQSAAVADSFFKRFCVQFQTRCPRTARPKSMQLGLNANPP